MTCLSGRLRLFPTRSEIFDVARRWRPALHSQEADDQLSPSPTGFFPTIRAIALCSWLNVLLVVVPVAVASYLVKANKTVVFTTNVISVIPLSALLTFATENLARSSGDALGALLNVTFGNLVEIVIFAALYHNQFDVVQASILGSILVNLLLILGTAILAGSFYYQEQAHNKDEAQALACLLSVSVFSLLIPNAFYHSIEDAKDAGTAVLTLSRASSITLLATYLLYIFFQIRRSIVIRVPNHPAAAHDPAPMSRRTHDGRSSLSLLLPRSIRFQDEENGDDHSLSEGFRKDSLELGSIDVSERSEIEVEENGISFQVDEASDNEDLPSARKTPELQPDKKTTPKNSIYQHPRCGRRPVSQSSSRRGVSQESMYRSGTSQMSIAGSTTSLPRLLLGNPVSDQDPRSEVDVPQNPTLIIGRKTSMCLLVVSSLLVAVCAEFMVNTLDDIVSSGPFTQSFIGLIILPIAGNCAEHITATTVATKGKFDLAIGVSIGSSVQISLFVTPLVVIAGWIIGREMTLFFGLFETVALFATTFLVNFLILNGRTNLLEGSLLCACYFIIGVGAYVFPTPKDQM
ncbi:calcium/proton exchanger [Rhinocladiella mackenziei CBS 650.93]|uniref:Rhinocladiella mackenziei CBS 650.93 unplaced genomic scaffold supercont1.6, whole genome shotgun sequence n=1 Tax=Rhinocladiella mackenziei CBS 650.93 TaxID=1442369 RepID=A0A0D2IGQ9_9EURO|nr:calcium/proton exchanger [Rhinocladiella mackenziei CBS 650.93]KIX02461.1 calcium/proton exchanger [Rhinocladiella mackenziei CBS 650.93]